MTMTSGTERSYRERILRVLVHVQDHLEDPLDLDRLARVASFSPCHFHRVFRGMTGETVMGHVRRLRLERAARRLKDTDHPIVRIAFEAGYEAHEAFTRAFKGHLGIAPSSFRERARAGGADVPDREPARALLDRSDESPPVVVRNLEQRRIAFVRHVGPYYGAAAAFQKLMAWAASRCAFGPGTRILGVAHDDPDVTPTDRLRFDAGVTVSDDHEAEGDVGIQVVAGGPYAVLPHHGPYDTLQSSYLAICGVWAPRAGRELRSAPCVEFYLNDPRTTPPESLLTEVCIPLG